MRLYVLGPMSNVLEFNAPEFRRVAQELRKMDHEVLSPVEFDEEEGFDHGQDSLEEDEYLGFLRRDLLRILEANVDGGVALDGWEESRGAALEVHVLRSLGKPIYRLVSKVTNHGAEMIGVLEPIKAPTKYQPPSDENVLEEAGRIVGGDRGDDYGHPGDDFARTAGAWKALFGWDVSPAQVALAMVVVKLSRLQETPDKRDSIVDIAGYARTYEMVLDRDRGAKHYPTTLPPA